jgi:HlyD family secretion protein
MSGWSWLTGWGKRRLAHVQHRVIPVSADFAPGLLAVQESPPARLPRLILQVVVTLCAILLLWAAFGKLDIIASAEGRLIPQTYLQIVQPADAGIVQEICVKEGETVHVGQVLIRLDRKMTEADAQSVKGDLDLKTMQLQRIEAELSGKPMPVVDGIVPALQQQTAAQYLEHRQAYADALAIAQQALHKAQQEYAAGQETLDKLKEVTPILKQQAQAYAEMGKDGYAPQVTVRDKQRDYIEKSRDLAAQQNTLASLAAAVDEAARQVAQVTSKYRSDLENERMTTAGDYHKLQEEWIKQEHKVALLELKAPQAGIVKDLATHTIGTVVSPGTVLLSIVPENEPLVAEVMVKNDDIGFIYPQQHVKVKLAAYPFEKYGMLDGTVLRIGPDANTPDNSSSSSASSGNNSSSNNSDKSATSTYKALISLKTPYLQAQNERFKLVPGMQVIAEINQGRRTVLEYLLSPISTTVHDSGRER